MARRIKTPIEKRVSMIVESTSEGLKSKASKVVDRAEQRIISLEISLINKLAGIVLILIGAVFFGLSLISLLHEIFELSLFLSYLIVGILIIILGLVLNNMKGGK